MRTLVALASKLTLACLFVACAGEEARETSITPPDPPPGATAAEEPRRNGVIVQRIDVAGVVATDLDHPIVGRRVVLVDARGARHELVTDGDGGFAVPGVVAPYDLAVAPASAGAPTTVFLTLRRNDPWLELSEREGPTPPLESQTIRVAVRAPACDLRCWVTAATASPSGSGATTTACDPEKDVLVVDVDHRWRGLTVVPGERIDVHLLVGNEDRSSFAYARIDGVAAAPGETTNLGMAAPAPVPATEPITIGVKGGRGALVDWRWSTSVFLDLSGGPMGPATGFLFAVTPEAAATVRLPLLGGARLSASVAASHPRGGGEGGFHRSAEVWSGTRALSVDPIELEIAPGPEIVRPASGGILSRRGLGFEWKSLGIAALSTLTVADTTRGSVRLRVMTTGAEVSFTRLAQLGVPKLELGDHVLDLSTSPGVGADDAVSPDSALRRRRNDRSRVGMTTYLRVPFQVTK